MCDHCGCRSITPVGELMAEHERIVDLAADVRRALDRGDDEVARSAYAAILVLLEPHVAKEERGLFSALREAGEFTEHVDVLEAEHADLHARVGTVDTAPAGWGAAVRELLDRLEAHIYKEDFGLFPGALAALDADAWEAVARVHEPSAI